MGKYRGHDIDEVMLGKDRFMSGRTQKGAFTYDCNPFFGQRREDIGVPNLTKQSPKKLGGGQHGYIDVQKTSAPETSSVDPWKALKTDLKFLGHHPREDLGMKMKKQSYRNPMARYLKVVGQIAENIQLDNTREARAIEIAEKRRLKREAFKQKVKETRLQSPEVVSAFDAKDKPETPTGPT